MSHGLAMRGIYSYGKALDVYSTAQSLDCGEITTTTTSSSRITSRRSVAEPTSTSASNSPLTEPGSCPPTMTPWSEETFLAAGNSAVYGYCRQDCRLPSQPARHLNPVFDSSGNVIGNKGGDYNADGMNYDVPNVPSFGRHLRQNKKTF